MRWLVVLVQALLLAALAATPACNGRSESGEETPPKSRIDKQGRVVLTAAEQEALGLLTIAAAEGTLTTRTLRFGRVAARPQEDALVVAPVTGRLAAPVATLGASVEEGDVLVVVEPLVDTASRANIEAERRRLRGQIESAQAEVKAKQADLERVTTLAATGLATEAERAQAEAALRSERARAESLRRANAELGQVTEGTLTLRAPAAGTVAALATDAGSLVQQGTILARVVRSGPRWIDVAVPPGESVGDDYRVRGTSGELPAHLINRGSVVQPDGTRRDRLQANPEAAANLPPGAIVPVEVRYNERGVVVPEEAVVRRGEERLVFVEVQEGRFAARTVTVGARADNRAVVTSGLSKGDRIVARGSASLLGELGMSRRDGALGQQ